jgi:hypothetical protein
MPSRAQVDAAFDGHHERPFHALTADERLDWLWECMVLLHVGRRQRAEAKRPGDGADGPAGA